MTAARLARPTFGIDASGHPLIGNVQVSVSLTWPDGTIRPVARVNQARTGSELVLLTPRFGPTTPADIGGTDVVLGGVPLPLTPTGVHQAVVLEVRPATGGIPIDPGTLVLNGPSGSFLDALVPGVGLTLTLSITPGWENVREAIGGREFIVQGGVADVSPRSAVADELHPRTALGITAAGSLVMATVDGRQSGYSTGVDLDELGQLMLSRGVVQALSLDGGSSTTMAVRLPGDQDVSVVNHPSAGQELAVANSLVVFSAVPTGPLAIVDVVPGTAVSWQGGVTDFVAKGQDAAYNGIALAPGDVTWTLDGPGAISATGQYTAAAPGDGDGRRDRAGHPGHRHGHRELRHRPAGRAAGSPSPASATDRDRRVERARPQTGDAASARRPRRSPRSAATSPGGSSGGAALAGQRVNVLVAKKTNGAWGSPTYRKSAWADAKGVVTFWTTASAAAAINVRVQWPGDPGHGVSTSGALGGYWR